jgi:hypothetical protein
MNILLVEFSSKLDREDIFKPTIENESSQEIIIDNGFRLCMLPFGPEPFVLSPAVKKCEG